MYKRIQDQPMNEKFDNMKPTQFPVWKKNTAEPVTITMAHTVWQELESAAQTLCSDKEQRGEPVTEMVSSRWDKENMFQASKKATLFLCSPLKTLQGKSERDSFIDVKKANFVAAPSSLLVLHSERSAVSLQKLD